MEYVKETITVKCKYYREKYYGTTDDFKKVYFCMADICMIKHEHMFSHSHSKSNTCTSMVIDWLAYIFYNKFLDPLK